MGYYTNYNLSTSNLDKSTKSKITNYLNGIAAGLRIGDIGEIKWYSHKHDMLKLSLLFPDVTFYLEGIGEDRDDMWKSIYKNGKTKTVEPIISWPELKLD